MDTTHEWSRTVQGEKKSWCWYSCVFKWNAMCFIFHLGGKTLEMTMGCGFCCCVSSLPALYFLLLLVTGWFSFLLQGQLAQSRWSPDTVIDQQQSGRDRRSVQNTQSFRRRAHASTPALHLHSAKEYPPEQATVFLPHSKILSSNNYRNITRGEERTSFQNSFACLDDSTLMQSRIRWVFIARKVWSRIINIWSRASYLIQLAHFRF